MTDDLDMLAMGTHAILGILSESWWWLVCHVCQALWREYTGAVMCVESLRGYLVMTVGNRLEMHYKQGNSLVKAAFFDAPLLVTSISIVKDFILLGDVKNSVVFLRYK